MKNNRIPFLALLLLLTCLLIGCFRSCHSCRCDWPAPPNLSHQIILPDSANLTWDAPQIDILEKLPGKWFIQPKRYQVIVVDLTDQDTIVNTITEEENIGVGGLQSGHDYLATVAAECASGAVSPNTSSEPLQGPVSLIIGDEVVMMTGQRDSTNWQACAGCLDPGDFYMNYPGDPIINNLLIPSLIDNPVFVYSFLIQIPSLGNDEFLFRMIYYYQCEKVHIVVDECYSKNGH